MPVPMPHLPAELWLACLENLIEPAGQTLPERAAQNADLRNASLVSKAVRASAALPLLFARTTVFADNPVRARELFSSSSLRLVRSLVIVKDAYVNGAGDLFSFLAACESLNELTLDPTSFRCLSTVDSDANDMLPRLTTLVINECDSPTLAPLRKLLRALKTVEHLTVAFEPGHTIDEDEEMLLSSDDTADLAHLRTHNIRRWGCDTPPALLSCLLTVPTILRIRELTVDDPTLIYRLDPSAPLPVNIESLKLTRNIKGEAEFDLSDLRPFTALKRLDAVEFGNYCGFDLHRLVHTKLTVELVKYAADPGEIFDVLPLAPVAEEEDRGCLKTIEMHYIVTSESFDTEQFLEFARPVVDALQQSRDIHLVLVERYQEPDDDE